MESTGEQVVIGRWNMLIHTAISTLDGHRYTYSISSVRDASGTSFSSAEGGEQCDCAPGIDFPTQEDAFLAARQWAEEEFK